MGYIEAYNTFGMGKTSSRNNNVMVTLAWFESQLGRKELDRPQMVFNVHFTSGGSVADLRW